MTARDGDTRLAEIAARAEAATPGPWHAADEHGLLEGADPAWCVSRMHDDGRWWHDVAYHASQSNGEQAERDFEFVAAARTDVPYLLGEVERLRAEVDALERTLDLENEADWEGRWQKAEAERDAAVAALNRVRALCDRATGTWDPVVDGSPNLIRVDDIRAAADVPEAPQ